MAGVQGNKNAETVTLQQAIELTEKAISVINKNCYSLSAVAEKCGTYRTKFHYLLEKFNDNEIVFDNIKRMYNKCEAIMTERALNNEANVTMSIFLLKTYHGLIETSKWQHEGGDSDKPIKTTIEWNGQKIEL